MDAANQTLPKISAAGRQLGESVAKDQERYLLAHPTEQIVQTIMLEMPDGDRGQFPCPWASQAERAASLAALRQLIKELSPTRYCIWSEVWVSQVNVGEQRKTEPRLDPRREEAVLTVVVEPGRAPWHRSQRIKRNDVTGEVVGLEAAMDIEMFGGALTELYGSD